MNEAKCMAAPPAQQLNDIASTIIDTLADVNNKASIIKDRLFGDEASKTSNTAEPCNLESRLRFIRTTAQDINDKLCEIQNRV
jgi:hypothetical protein